MQATVHSLLAIETMLRRGLTPITDNADALAHLGFQRAYPQVKNGYDSMIWERSVDVGKCNCDGRRQLVRERAFYVHRKSEN
jgi:hypothetical protein